MSDAAMVGAVMGTSNRKLRHLLQVTFWGGYGFGSYLLMRLYSPASDGGLLILVTLILSLWPASEVLRATARRRGWLTDGPRLALGVLVWVPLLALGAQLVVHLVLAISVRLQWVTLPGGGDYRPVALVSYWINTVVMLGIWTAIWLGVHYFRQYRQGEIARWRAEADRQRLELDALKSRLNPHFVFNALNNVRALINEDKEAARKAVTQLSNTLRYALYHSRKTTVTLRDELTVVRDYLSLEQLHFEQRLRLTEAIAPVALDAHVPPMLLQTLVENAVKHGIATTPSGGELHISARLAEHHLILTVENPGQLTPAQRDDGGVGLAYLRAELAERGQPHGFSLTEDGGKVRARLEILQ